MRLSLWPRHDINAQMGILADGTFVKKDDWLRAIFSEHIEFDYRGSKFHFVPTTDEIPEPFIAGRIGQRRQVRENEPPEAGLEEMTRDSWKAIAVLIDPRGHKDGQKVAVEFGTGVAKPFPTFRALISHINRLKPAPPFKVEVKPIVDATDFWQFVAEHEGRVTSVTFEFLAPNMFGIEDDMDREAAELRKYEKAQRAALTIESDAGLQLHTERVKRTVKYTSRGGGTIHAKAGRDRFSSDSEAKRVRVPEEPVGSDPNPTSLRSRIARAIRYVFGHEEQLDG